MRAAVVSNDPAEPALAVVDRPDPELPDGSVLVRLRSAALNRLDQMSIDDRASLDQPAVLGSDGAGVVEAVGASVSGIEVGAEVVISPSLDWGDSEAVQGPDYEILGSPIDGTHAELVAVPAENVHRKPERLSWAETAALPMAGLTAWRALVTRGRLRAGETVVVGAASSGVSSFAIQIAAELGARVVAISSSEDKLDEARALGADAAVLRTSPDFRDELVAATGGAADLALDPTGALWQPMIDSLRPGGRLVVVGRRASNDATVRVHSVFWKQIDILGSSMGSPADFAAFIDHVAQATWRPAIDSVHRLEDIEAAYDRLNAADRIGKVVLDIG
jgi:NADPH:quinone reductase-like Zn-dependent oxidoreductase